MEFLSLFDEVYGPKLMHRAVTMRAAFEHILALKPRGHLIVETGCARKIEGDNKTYGPQVPPSHPWYPTGWHGPWSDGMSTVLFDKFAQMTQGKVYSVDISPENCKVAQEAVSDRTLVTCSDSVLFLENVSSVFKIEDVDLLYLDSFDLDWNNPHASALHHLKELAVVYAKLRPGCVILVDDCYDVNGRQGKGKYVEDFFTHFDMDPVVKGYQLLWIK